MTADKLAILIAVIGAGSYFQTVTGFGLGMIVMGVTSGFGLAPLATVATLMSVVSLANGATALPGRLHHIDWRRSARRRSASCRRSSPAWCCSNA